MDTSKAIVEKITLPISDKVNFNFEVKRDDLIDIIVSGNKWRKLEYNILKAQEQHKKGILTFGGAYSNHLIATAKVAKLKGLHAIGIVRGDELNSKSNAILEACAQHGMELIFVSREEYRQRYDTFYLQHLATVYPEYFMVPEGGMNYYGMIGCQNILKETENNYTHIYLAGGTGTTAAGILLSTPSHTKVHLVSALKGDFLQQNISDLLYTVFNDFEMVEEYISRLEVDNFSHFGGFGKAPKDLLEFILDIYSKVKLKLEPIYTGKACYKMVEDFKNRRISTTDRVLFIHTGGLESTKSWKKELFFL